MTTPNYAEKIAALLRKAEDPAATPAEAESYTAKAEALMVKWGVSEAVARKAAGQDVPREQIIEKRYPMSGTYHRGMYEIGSAVAKALGLRVLIAKTQYRTTLYVIGHEGDVGRFDVLFASLQLQAISAMDAWTRGERDRGVWAYRTHHEKFKARRQFLMSFGWAVAKRIRETERVEVATYAGKAEIALRDRRAEIDDWLSQMYGGSLRKTRGIEATWYGAEGGRAAGQRARLGGSTLPGARREIS